MDIFKAFDLNIFALIIAVIIYYNEHKINKQRFFTYQAFLDLVVFTGLLLILDILGWIFNALPGTLNYTLNWVFNLLLYLFAVMPAGLWFIYAHFQVFRDIERIKKVRKLVYIIIIINSILAILSIKTGWYFYIDAQNIYHRGSLFSVHIFLSYILLIITSGLIFLNRKNIEPKNYKSLLLFPIPPFLGSIIQILYYGLSLNWSCMVLSLLIIYFNIQNMGLNTDYLTGVFNRRQLDSYLSQRIKTVDKNNTFASILIDLDKFKSINDTMGHYVGDEALKSVAKILRSCLRADDFVARFGGDEFFILLDIGKNEKLEEIVNRINKATEQFNQMNKKKYSISFSMGYDIYNYESNMKAEDFVNYLDKMMYENKQDKKTDRK